MLDQTTQTPYSPRHEEGASTAELVNRAATQMSTLVRSELALAKAELADKAKRAGAGGGLLGGAGVLAMYGIGLLLALFVALLDLVMPLWVAILVVLVVVLAVAAVLALVGRNRLMSATPAAPTEASTSVRADVNAVRDAFRYGRHGRRSDDRHGEDRWGADWLRDDGAYGSDELYDDRMRARRLHEDASDERSPYGDRAYGSRNYGEQLYDEHREQVAYGDRPFGDKPYKDSQRPDRRPEDETYPGWR
jgi:hypothetical protein